MAHPRSTRLQQGSSANEMSSPQPAPSQTNRRTLTASGSSNTPLTTRIQSKDNHTSSSQDVELPASQQSRQAHQTARPTRTRLHSIKTTAKGKGAILSALASPVRYNPKQPIRSSSSSPTANSHGTNKENRPPVKLAHSSVQGSNDGSIGLERDCIPSEPTRERSLLRSNSTAPPNQSSMQRGLGRLAAGDEQIAEQSELDRAMLEGSSHGKTGIPTRRSREDLDRQDGSADLQAAKLERIQTFVSTSSLQRSSDYDALPFPIEAAKEEARFDTTDDEFGFFAAQRQVRQQQQRDGSDLGGSAEAASDAGHSSAGSDAEEEVGQGSAAHRPTIDADILALLQSEEEDVAQESQTSDLTDDCAFAPASPKRRSQRGIATKLKAAKLDLVSDPGQEGSSRSRAAKVSAAGEADEIEEDDDLALDRALGSFKSRAAEHSIEHSKGKARQSKPSASTRPKKTGKAVGDDEKATSSTSRQQRPQAKRAKTAAVASNSLSEESDSGAPTSRRDTATGSSSPKARPKAAGNANKVGSKASIKATGKSTGAQEPRRSARSAKRKLASDESASEVEASPSSPMRMDGPPSDTSDIRRDKAKRMKEYDA